MITFTATIRGFNPCFSGMAFGTDRKAGKRTVFRSFNPCFSGMAFGTMSNRLPSEAAKEVSILVFLEWPLGRRGLVAQEVPAFVSILVFLEWPLGPATTCRSFWDEPAFQSLFFWNGLWDTDVTVRMEYELYEFQSLFFWNGLWDVGPCPVVGSNYLVSILVFLEWPLGHAHLCGDHRFCRVSILVFLEWPLGRRSFHDRLPSSRVSILVFLEWPLGLISPIHPYRSTPGFQSLFFWNGLWDSRSPGRPCPDSEVSILVFLEWPLGRLYGCVCTPRTFVSILVFLEWPLGHTHLVI